MALISCAECGRQISDKAAACPQCGAPPNVYVGIPSLPDEAGEASVDVTQVEVAAHVDGRQLMYDEDYGMFDLGDEALEPGDVAALDRLQQLSWTRYDVRLLMHKSAREGLPMEPLPVAGGPSMLERTSAFLDKAADSLTDFTEALEPPNSAMVCPHCQSRGTVRTRKVKQKKGISGGKATAAVLTQGMSLLATGLSRKENVTEARCRNCGSVWYF